MSRPFKDLAVSWNETSRIARAHKCFLLKAKRLAPPGGLGGDIFTEPFYRYLRFYGIAPIGASSETLGQTVM